MTRRPAHEREGGVVVLLLILGLAVLGAAGYAAASLVAADRVPRGTSVQGVEIGGRSPADAQRVLQTGLDDRLREPITVTVGGLTDQLVPEQAGISVDYAATVERAGAGWTFNPAELWDYYDGGEEVDAAVLVDPGRMTAELDRISAATGTQARDGAISFANGRAEIVEPRPGAVVDTERAAALIVEAWAQEEPQVALPLAVSEPRIDDADLQQAVRDFANPALSGPVTLVFKGSKATLAPREYAPLLRTKVRDGRLVPDVRSGELAALVALDTRDAEPRDATVELRGGTPRVVRAKQGATYGPLDLTRAFMHAVVQGGDARTVRVEGAPVPAAFTTADARALKVTELVSSTTVPAAADPDLQAAAARLAGTVLRPGETFSLNDRAGQAGAASASLATAAYDAAYVAGLEIVERTAPSQRLQGAPLGREATVTFGSVDLRWRNDTANGVLVDAAVDPAGWVTVSLWSTPTWQVATSLSAKRNVTAPPILTMATADCVPTSGKPGFEVDVTRELRPVGEDAVVRTDTAHTAYLPTEAVVCVPPASTEPAVASATEATPRD